MRTILAIIFMTFATQASAKEIIMACGSYTFKYDKPLLRKASIIYQDAEAPWQKWCDMDGANLYLNGLEAICDFRKAENPFMKHLMLFHILNFQKGTSEHTRPEGVTGKQFKKCIFLKN